MTAAIPVAQWEPEYTHPLMRRLSMLFNLLRTSDEQAEREREVSYRGQLKFLTDREIARLWDNTNKQEVAGRQHEVAEKICTEAGNIISQLRDSYMNAHQVDQYEAVSALYLEEKKREHTERIAFLVNHKREGECPSHIFEKLSTPERKKAIERAKKNVLQDATKIKTLSSGLLGNVEAVDILFHQAMAEKKQFEQNLRRLFSMSITRALTNQGILRQYRIYEKTKAKAGIEQIKVKQEARKKSAKGDFAAVTELAMPEQKKLYVPISQEDLEKVQKFNRLFENAPTIVLGHIYRKAVKKNINMYETARLMVEKNLGLSATVPRVTQKDISAAIQAGQWARKKKAGAIKPVEQMPSLQAA